MGIEYLSLLQTIAFRPLIFPIIHHHHRIKSRMHLPSGLLPFALAALAPLAASADQIPLQRQSSSNSPITSIPQLGFGTWRLDKSNASEAVALAIQTGYTHIDCAAIYGNEVEVGKGIAEGLRRSGRKREDIWVTSKLWNDQ